MSWVSGVTRNVVQLRERPFRERAARHRGEETSHGDGRALERMIRWQGCGIGQHRRVVHGPGEDRLQLTPSRERGGGQFGQQRLEVPGCDLTLAYEWCHARLGGGKSCADERSERPGLLPSLCPHFRKDHFRLQGVTVDFCQDGNPPGMVSVPEAVTRVNEHFGGSRLPPYLRPFSRVGGTTKRRDDGHQT